MTGRSPFPRAVWLVLASSTSFQLGTAIAINAFDVAGPMGAAWLRGLAAALIMLVVVRPDWRTIDAPLMRAVLPYSLTLVALVTLNYAALSLAPLGVVTAILMLGPLAVTAWGYRGAVDLVCVGIAALGVVVLSLADGADGPTSALGILLALLGAAAFAGYVVTGKRLGQVREGFDGLAVALVVAAVLLTPFGLAFGQAGMWEPRTVLALVAAAVLATVLPFSLEITALRRLSAATFGLVLSFEPAIAAVVGLVVLGESLVPVQLVGIALVIVASVGTLGPRGWTRRLGAENRALMSNPTVAALATVPLFSGLSAKDLATIASTAEERTVAAGTVLTEEGAAGDEFFVVADGEVAVTLHGREVRRLGPGDFLGEIALVFGGTRTATATAATDSRLYVIGDAAFAAMIKSQPKIEDKILTSVSERMRYR